MRTRLLVLGFALAAAFSCPAIAGEAQKATCGRSVPSWVREIREIRGTLGGQLMFRAALANAVGTLGLLLLAAALASARVARAERLLRQARWKSVIVGILTAVVLLALAFMLGAAARTGGPVPAILGVVILGFLIWLAAHGLAGLARLVGRRLCGEGEWSQWRLVGVGGLPICATLLIPLFGWALFIYFFCRGVGAATLALFGVGPALPAEPSGGEQSEPRGESPPSDS